MNVLLPDRLRVLWRAVDESRLTREEFQQEHDRLLQESQQSWSDALIVGGRTDLTESLLSELGEYFKCDDLAELQRRCNGAVDKLKTEWHEQVQSEDQRAIEHFYDRSETTVYELMGWHSLQEDKTPLAYVTALNFARRHGCRHYLDFGSGVGSGAILFATHGFDVTLADISSTLLRFSGWRLERRGLAASYVDLKTQSLPQNAYDFVTAMDVFEHLVDPVATVEQLSRALCPGGFLYARIAVEADENRPQHLVQDFGPTFDRMRQLGLFQVWEDTWLWGHQVFQKISD